mgnify:CR=1 FL=1
MSKTVLASVVVLSYNHEKYVGQALDSVISQKTNFPFEIVVSDDGSKDNTRVIVEAYEKKYPGLVKVLPAAPNKGVVINFRDTILQCSGKYIAVCSADDFWQNPGKLQMQVDFLEKNADYGLVHTDTDVLCEDLNLLIKSRNKKRQPQMPNGNVFEELLAGKFYITTVTACFRKQCFIDYVDADEFVKHGINYEDISSWLEISRHTKFKYIDESTSTYRILSNSIAHNPDRNKRNKIIQDQYNIKQFFIRKYNASSDIVAENEIKYNIRKFNLAFLYKDYNEALLYYNFLKDKNGLTRKMRVKKTLLQYPVLYKMAETFQKLFRPASAINEMSI